MMMYRNSLYRKFEKNTNLKTSKIKGISLNGPLL